MAKLLHVTYGDTQETLNIDRLLSTMGKQRAKVI